jgi:hypothetical protein
VKCVAAAVVVAFTVVVLGAAAGAESPTPTTIGPQPTAPTIAKYSPASAKRAANKFVSVLLQHSAGETPWCDQRTQRGFTADHRVYLASCATKDGSFQFFTLVTAERGSGKLDAPYYKAQLAKICATGHAYATGVQGLFANTYAGTGAAADDANNLAGAAAQGFKSAEGYVAPLQLC